MWLPSGSEPLLAIVLDGPMEPDVSAVVERAGGGAPPPRARLAGVAGSGERIDPATGQVRPVPDPHAGRLDLAPYGAVLLHFAHAATPARGPARDGLLTGLALTPIPAAGGDPASSGGPFVRSELVAAPAESGTPPAWDVRSTITRGDVDTFAFVEWACRPAADLSGTLGLIVEADVPEGHRRRSAPARGTDAGPQHGIDPCLIHPRRVHTFVLDV